MLICEHAHERGDLLGLLFQVIRIQSTYELFNSTRAWPVKCDDTGRLTAGQVRRCTAVQVAPGNPEGNRAF